MESTQLDILTLYEIFSAKTDKDKSRYIEKREGDEHINKTGHSQEPQRHSLRMTSGCRGKATKSLRLPGKLTVVVLFNSIIVTLTVNYSDFRL